MIYTGNIIEYPYKGAFYEEVEDMSLPLTERESRLLPVFETECDILENAKTETPALISSFSVYFPFDISETLPIRRGMMFKGDMCGQEVAGTVLNVVVSQLGGVVAYVKDYSVE